MKLHLPIGSGPFPVVIVSHGAGGNLDSNFAQAQHLASHGFATLCVDHVGSNTKSLFAGGVQIAKTIAEMTSDAHEVLNRPKDISFAIDQIEQWHRTDDRLRGKFDVRKVAVLGHSFGAYTTLVVCGARPALDWLRPASGTGLGPDLSDRRVQCGVALSPQGPGAPFFLPESYQTIDVPLLGISGSRDRQQNFEPIHRKRSFQYWPAGDRFLLWISNANHLSFSDPTGSPGHHRRAKSQRIVSRREDVQKVSRAATLQFLNIYLKKKSRVMKIRGSDFTPYLGGIVNKIELLSK